jgi:hypothetical protein
MVLPLLLAMGESTASAAEIRDGNDFSFSAPAETCLQFPPEQFDPASCSGLKPIVSAPSGEPHTRIIAVGQIFFDDGVAHAQAFLIVSFLEQKPSFDMADVRPNEFAAGELKGLVDSTGADRGASRVRSAALVTIADVHFLRTSLDLTGLPAGKELFEHVVGYGGRSDAGQYQVMVGTQAAHAAALEALLDSAANSLRIARPAQPRAYWLGYWTGEALGVFTAVAGVIVLIVVLRRRRRHK